MRRAVPRYKMTHMRRVDNARRLFRKMTHMRRLFFIPKKPGGESIYFNNFSNISLWGLFFEERRGADISFPSQSLSA